MVDTVVYFCSSTIFILMYIFVY